MSALVLALPCSSAPKRREKKIHAGDSGGLFATAICDCACAAVVIRVEAMQKDNSCWMVVVHLLLEFALVLALPSSSALKRCNKTIHARDGGGSFATVIFGDEIVAGASQRDSRHWRWLIMLVMGFRGAKGGIQICKFIH